MSDLVRRAQKAKALVGDTSVPKWQRLAQGLQAFSGLELTEIPDEVCERLEADLARVNQVLAQYPLETVEDYHIISDVDLQPRISHLTPRTLAHDLRQPLEKQGFGRSICQGDRGTQWVMPKTMTYGSVLTAA